MNFGSSPLLDMGTSQQQPQMMDDELQKVYEAIQQKRASINMQAQQSSTPLWDEIDKIEDNLTGAQRQYLMQNQEYVDSLQYVSKLVQDEELRIIRTHRRDFYELRYGKGIGVTELPIPRGDGRVRRYGA